MLETCTRRVQHFQFHFRPHQSLVLYLLNDKERLPVFHVIDDPLFRKIGFRDVVYAEWQKLSRSLVEVVRGVLVRHLGLKYEDMRYGKMSKAAEQYWAEAVQETCQKCVTKWIVRLPSETWGIIFSPPDRLQMRENELYRFIQEIGGGH